MWKDRLEREAAQEHAKAARRADREAERAAWREAWEVYKVHRWTELDPTPRPAWWNLPGWVRYLLRLHAPGGRY